MKEYRPDRGRVLCSQELEALDEFQRYMPENGTAVAARTFPACIPRARTSRRGSGHNKFGDYTETQMSIRKSSTVSC